MENSNVISANVETNTLVAFVLYYVFIVSIGFYFSKFSSSGMNEFFLGGRKMKRFVVALSAVVSGRSAWLLLGVSGLAYTRGVSAVWTVVGYIVVEFFLFVIVAVRLRRETEATDSLTIPDYFEARYNDHSGVLRIVSASIILIFMVTYVAAQFSGGGKAFHASFGIDANWGIAITMGIVLVFTILGGFSAVSVIDMIQAICMILALIILPAVAIIKFGGLSEMWSILKMLNPRLVDPMALTTGALIGFVGIGLGSPGNPHILVRYMSIDDPRQLRVSAIIGTIWNILMAGGAIFIGLIGRAMFPGVDLLPAADTEQLYPFLAQKHLPPFWFGLILASIFAAIMSTADSQLLVAASAVVRDVYQKIFRKKIELAQIQLVNLSRAVIFILVLFALFLAIVAQKMIFWLVLFAWGGLGASFGPSVLLSLFWKKTTKWGVLAGLISGTLVVIIWNQIAVLKNFVYELIPAFIISTILVIVVSLFTEREHTNKCQIEPVAKEQGEES